MNSTNKIVQNALKAKACNTSQLELSLRYAGRLQSELRDVARSGNGRVSSSNTVEFPNEDAAEDAMEYLVRYAHVPKDEVWINSRVKNSAVAANAVDPLDALSSAETFMRQAIGELGKVNDPDFRPLASKIAVKLKAVQGELRRELEG